MSVVSPPVSRSTPPPLGAPRILIGAGSRDTEDLLFEKLDALLGDASIADLDRPIRVIVPSISLRDHTTKLLVERRRAVIGCQVQTLYHVALEILARLGRRAPPGSGVFDLMVERLARDESELRELLEDLDDGYRIVAATVRDFLDAGLEPVHREALDEMLSISLQPRSTKAQIRRVRALLRVAVATQVTLQELGLEHRSSLLRAARDAVETRDPDHLLPTRALFVHGFGDATGVVTDLIESLLRRFAGTLLLDHPPQPSGDEEAESAFTEHFLTRLRQLAAPRVIERRREPADIALFQADDPHAELREVAQRIRSLLDDGASAEGIAVVARDPQPLRFAVRSAFDEFGVPFSGIGVDGPLTAHGRRLLLLLDVLRRRENLPIDRWLDAAPLPIADDEDVDATRAEFRRRLFARGLGRLGDLAGFASPDERLLPLCDDARAALAVLTQWRRRRSDPFSEHLAILDEFLDERLGWDDEAREIVRRQTRDLHEGFPSFLRLSDEEFIRLLQRALSDRLHAPLGGQGAGVQVLGAMQARGRTFDHLFLVQMNRDVFPRPIREDPLLDEMLRRGLRRLLPDLPIKSSGFDEERYLFAQMLSAAPRATLSWARRSSIGRESGPRERSPSPLLERLPIAVRKDLDATAEADERQVRRRPLRTALIDRAVLGERADFFALLPIAVQESLDVLAADARSSSNASGDAVRRLCESRRQILAELDPDVRRHSRGGPYFGRIGPIVDEDDPRLRDLAVTVLEGYATCPWQTYLQRLLRLRPLADPLASLPQLRGALVGDLVHKTLEAIAGLDAWPEAPALREMLAQQARRVLASHGIHLAGLARAAAEAAMPFLDVAKSVDWKGASPTTAGAERRESRALPESLGGRRLLFQADRVDDLGDGALLYTDYKTGRAAPPAGREARLSALDRGAWLQAAAYVYGLPSGSAGRYLMLRPEHEGERSIRAEAGDVEMEAAFERTLEDLVRAWNDGVFFPRLLLPDEDREPARCRNCSVAQACLRRDSGARRRLRLWTTEGEDAPDPIFRELWRRGPTQ